MKRPVPFAPSEAVAPGQVWAADFMEDRLTSGRKLWILNVMDINSRYALGSLVEPGITGALAAQHLERLFRRYGASRVLRRDGGTEFEAKVFQKLLLTCRLKDEVVPKAQPYDNGHLESFNGSLREELLEAEIFETLAEAQTKVANWLVWYNGERPHQGLGYATPRECWEAAPQGAPDIYGLPPPAGRLAECSHVGVNPTLSYKVSPF